MSFADIALRVVLVLSGAFVVFTGADFALGGIISLGLEGPPMPASFAEADGFHVRDSHTRFIGGVWLGVGLVLLASAVWFRALRTALLACVVLIFIGGVSRFSAGQPDILFGPQVIVPLTLELIGMPLLFYWVWHAQRT